MSNIFKRIKSIEPTDDDVLDALVRRSSEPNDGSSADGTIEQSAAQSVDDIKNKPLNLTVPIDDDDDLGVTYLNDDTAAKDEEPKPSTPPKIRPLGLTPVASTDKIEKPTAPKKPKLDKPKAVAKPIVRPVKLEEKSTTASDAVPAFVTRTAPAQLTPPQAPKFRAIWIIGAVAALVWIAVATALAISQFSASGALSSLSIWQMAGLAVFTLIPALFIISAAYALRQLAKLSVQSDTLARVSDAMMQPDETVVTRTAIMSRSVRTEIDAVNQKISAALDRMNVLDDVVKSQTTALSQSTLAAENTTETIATTLTAQRDALGTVADSFERRMESLSTVLDAHSENLTASTQRAEQKIQEARLSIEDAAEKINAASDVVRGNAMSAAETLSGSHTEITMLGNAVKTRSDEMDVLYRKHLSDLSAMIDHLSKEQEEMGASLEARLETMRDMSLSAKLGAQSLSEASEKGRETVEALADAARLTDTAVRARFSEMEDMVKYSTARAESISETAARQVQNSLSTTRKDIARIEADMMDMIAKLDATAAERKLDRPSIADVPLSLSSRDMSANDKNEIEASGTQSTAKPRRIKLRPLDSDFPSIEPAVMTDDVATQTVDSPEDIAPPPVAPETLFRLDDVPTVDSDGPEIDESEPVNLTTNAVEPAQLTLEPLPLEPLALEPLDPSDLTAPDPDTALVNYDPDVVRRAAPDGDNESVKPKSKGLSARLKGLFGASAEPVAAPPLASASSPAPTPTARATVDPDDIIASLTGLGLTPSVIVDDGCIIEAANLRKSKTSRAMAQAMAERLKDPVAHLRRALAQDPALKSDLTHFANDMASELSAIETDREAIRVRLESENGRAYLLTVAALVSA